MPGALLRRKQNPACGHPCLSWPPVAQPPGTGQGRGESVHMLSDGDSVRQAEWAASSGLLQYRSPLAPLLHLYPTPIHPVGCHMPASSIILTPLLPQRVNQELIRR